ncbi:anthranilate phosphoribosyltransferase [soil metagenome]
MNRSRDSERPGASFRELLKERARGPAQLGHRDPELCERAMEGILSGEATPAQAAAFLLVGRAAGDSPPEIAAYARAASRFVRKLDTSGENIATVAGGFDGKLRTMNVGAASSLVAAAAGAKVVVAGGEKVPTKEGRTVFDALRNLGVAAPQNLDEAARSLEQSGFAATTSEHYLPELHSLLGLRWEMARRTSLNVIEKLVSPVPGSARMVGVTHGSFLKSVPAALVGFGVGRALVFQAVEGSDEAPLDGKSSLVLVRDGGVEEFHIEPESLGLGRAGGSDIPWRDEKDESSRIMAALISGERGAVRNLIAYNAALRLWMSKGGSASLEESAEKVRDALDSGTVAELMPDPGGKFHC